MTVTSVCVNDAIKKTMDSICITNAYPKGRAMEAGILMFIEATPEEQAKKMRIVKQFYK